MRARILMAALAAIPVAISAHADTPASPYAGQQTRAIKALSPEDIDELRTGAGMGLAKAAELNGYPGPLHVLALAKELRLTHGQMRQVTDIRERMSAAAKPLGGEIIDREQELDRLFAQGQITPERLSAGTAAIGAAGPFAIGASGRASRDPRCTDARAACRLSAAAWLRRSNRRAASPSSRMS